MKPVVPALILFSLLCSACSTATATPAVTTTSVPLPILVVDQEHMDAVNLVYEIPAGSGFTLHAAEYDFGSEIPTVVELLVGPYIYQTTWATDTGQQDVRVSDLEPLYNSPPLETLTTGQDLIVSIGRLTSQGSFSPIWVGKVKVK